MKKINLFFNSILIFNVLSMNLNTVMSMNYNKPEVLDLYDNSQLTCSSDFYNEFINHRPYDDYSENYDDDVVITVYSKRYPHLPNPTTRLYASFISMKKHYSLESFLPNDCPANVKKYFLTRGNETLFFRESIVIESFLNIIRKHQNAEKYSCWQHKNIWETEEGKRFLMILNHSSLILKSLLI